MAFTRSYSEQGDPWQKRLQRRTLRAGALKRPGVAALLRPRPAAPLAARFRPMLATPRDRANKYRRSQRLMLDYAGDPFFKKLGKFLKRATKPPPALRKIIAKVAPFSQFLQFIPGIGPVIARASALAKRVQGSPIGQAYESGRDIMRSFAGAPPSYDESPESYAPELQGTVSQRYYGRQPLSEPEFEEYETDEPDYEAPPLVEYDDDDDDEAIVFESEDY